MEPGDLLLFDSHLMHRSTDNDRATASAPRWCTTTPRPAPSTATSTRPSTTSSRSAERHADDGTGAMEVVRRHLRAGRHHRRRPTAPLPEQGRQHRRVPLGPRRPGHHRRHARRARRPRAWRSSTAPTASSTSRKATSGSSPSRSRSTSSSSPASTTSSRFAIGLAGAVIVGAVVELALVRRFFRAPRLILTVATIGIAQLLAFAALVHPAASGTRARSPAPSTSPSTGAGRSRPSSSTPTTPPPG